MTFLISEDKALRETLQGIVVHDQRSDGVDIPRQVGVWFGQPDQEARAQNYPYITIDMIDINRDPQREMRGKTNADYLLPASVDPTTIDDFEVDLPIPVTLDYQVTTYARHPRHDRELLAQLLYQRLPFRFGNISVTEKSVVVGNTTTNHITMRRMDVIDVSKRDAVEEAKRLFMNSVTVRISSEIPALTYRKLYQVLHVDITGPTTERSQSGRFLSAGEITIP
jgi:hypothetical protein